MLATTHNKNHSNTSYSTPSATLSHKWEVDLEWIRPSEYRWLRSSSLCQDKEFPESRVNAPLLWGKEKYPWKSVESSLPKNIFCQAWRSPKPTVRKPKQNPPVTATLECPAWTPYASSNFEPSSIHYKSTLSCSLAVHKQTAKRCGSSE